jgi:hypothetical protein
MATSTIVATVGSATANSYCTLAVADQYHDDRPAVGTTWSAETDANKNRSLMWATKLLDALITWRGNVVDDVQALDWPRYGLSHTSGYAVDSDAIPVHLESACAEFARQLLAEDRAADSDIQTQGITRLKAASVELQFKDSVFAKVIPDVVVNLVPNSWYSSVRGRPHGIKELVRA